MSIGASGCCSKKALIYLYAQQLASHRFDGNRWPELRHERAGKQLPEGAVGMHERRRQFNGGIGALAARIGSSRNSRTEVMVPSGRSPGKSWTGVPVHLRPASAHRRQPAFGLTRVQSC